MIKIDLKELEQYIKEAMGKLGLSGQDSQIMADIYMETTKRGVGHHDIYNLPSRVEGLLEGRLNPAPHFQKLASYGCMERWDGDNGLGEIINHFSMDRAVELAMEHGIGMCVMRNSNHYLCSAPYVLQAADKGCIGMVIAKGVPTMGMPGISGRLVGQSPIGFAFPVGNGKPAFLDICLAYASGEQLASRARENQPVPIWWGVDSQGRPTASAAELQRGTKYPIGEHKGFGLAILCELLTGVLSGGLILDENEDEPGIRAKSTSHAAIAIKADALMDWEEYQDRSSELIQRLRARGENVHIPGDSSWEKTEAIEREGCVWLTEDLTERLNEYGKSLGLGISI